MKKPLKHLGADDYKLYKGEVDTLERLESQRAALQTGLNNFVGLDDRIKWFSKRRFDRILK